MTESFDVIIIGAGSAGLSALREVRRQTDSFILINAGHYGTTCARVGCMPSKALIESANALHRRHHFAELGIGGSAALHVDISAVLERVRGLRDDFVRGTLELTASLGTRSIAGHAKFLAPDTVQVGARELRGKAIVLATGSRPLVPPHWSAFGERIITSDSLFEQRTLPATLAVVGMGAIGVEIAQALSRLGVQITAFSAGQSVAGLTDPEVNARAIELLQQEFTLHCNAHAEPAVQGDGMRVGTTLTSVAVDAVFAALGRRPNIDGIAMERLGVTLDEHGLPPVNRQSMQIADLPVYLAGDATDDRPLLHEATDEGHIGGYNAVRPQLSCFRRRTPLSIVFCDPNIAMIGARFADLDRKKVAIGSVDFARQGRARIACENRGLLRIYARQRDGLILGAELCAPHGEHLAHLLALAIEQECTVPALLRMPFYHPVVEEGLRTALRDIATQLDHKPDSDLASCEPIGAEALE